MDQIQVSYLSCGQVSHPIRQFQFMERQNNKIPGVGMGL